jgi:RNA polymerase sigma-70 factor, ECF subfamily
LKGTEVATKGSQHSRSASEAPARVEPGAPRVILRSVPIESGSDANSVLENDSRSALIADLARIWSSDGLMGTPAGILRDALEAAEQGWPTLQIPRDLFVNHLATCILSRAPLEPLAHAVRLHLTDLYLACACLQGYPAALKELESLLQTVPAIVRSLSPDRGFADDVRSTIAEELLTSAHGKTPKLARYHGQGSLRGWFTVVVQRTALAMKHAGAAMQPVASMEDFSDLLAVRFEPEIELLRGRFLPQLKAAMREAAKQLSTRQRTVLRLSLVERISMQKIAACYGVNQSTVSRWISDASEELSGNVRASLHRNCDLQDSELDSLIAAVRSRVEVSLSGLLATRSDAQRTHELP